VWKLIDDAECTLEALEVVTLRVVIIRREKKRELSWVLEEEEKKGKGEW
jgi:hypothetical protein